MNIYEELENKFKIVYPDNPNATYVSILNYSDDLLKPFQRWFRYKEGYSIELVYKILEELKDFKCEIVKVDFEFQPKANYYLKILK